MKSNWFTDLTSTAYPDSNTIGGSMYLKDGDE